MTFPTLVIPEAGLVEILVDGETISVNTTCGCLLRIERADAVVVQNMGGIQAFARLDRSHPQ